MVGMLLVQTGWCLHAAYEAPPVYTVSNVMLFNHVPFLHLVLLSQIVGASTPDLDRLQVSTDRESRKMLQGYAAQYSREISTLLLRIPHELLLLLKTNDCLRSVDNILVGQK
jgi:hypothetical protein